MCAKRGNQDGKMTLNFKLQTSVPYAKSGSQMCLVWLRVFKLFFFLISCQHLKLGRFQIEVPSSLRSPRQPWPRLAHSNNCLIQVASAPSLGCSFSCSPQSYPTCFHLLHWISCPCQHLSLGLLFSTRLYEAFGKNGCLVTLRNK